MIPRTQLLEILEKSKKATQGNFVVTSSGEYHHIAPVGHKGYPYAKCIKENNFFNENTLYNAQFIASVNPQVIQELLTRLIEAEDCLGFYGDKSNWQIPEYVPHCVADTINNDYEINEIQSEMHGETVGIGGRRARVYRKKWGLE